MMQIAIDGPAGSGKSTISQAIAKKLGINYLDTGAMYRICTLNVLNKDIDLDADDEIIKVTKDIMIDIKDGRFFLNEVDVSEEIRTEKVSKNVSRVASILEVRQQMVILQKQIAKKNDVIMDGRDIGTHVLPNADFKFYLNASIDERARRRFNEQKENNKNVSYEAIKKNIVKRDKLDMNRDHAPLIKADDAIEIDTTNMSIDEVVYFIMSKVGEKQ